MVACVAICIQSQSRAFSGSDVGDTGMELGSDSGEGGSSPCDHDGMDLDSNSDGGAEGAVKPAAGWRPGRNCGSFDGFRTPLVQVILTNLHLNARRLGSDHGHGRGT